MRKYKICHLTTVHDPFDVRIFKKECRSLAREFDVVLLAPIRAEASVDQVRIIPFDRSWPQVIEGQGRWRRIIFRPLSMFVTAWVERADLYHFHDPELMPVAFFLRLCGKKVVYDVHEDVPKDVMTKAWLGPVIVRRIVSSLFSAVEWLAGHLLSGVVAVIPEIARRFPSEKTVVVYNYPETSLILDAPSFDPYPAFRKVIYAGGLSRIRGILEMIEAVGILRRNPAFEDVRLLLAGHWETPEYRDECRKSPGWEAVLDVGTVQQRELFSWMKSCEVGMVNFLPAPNNLHSLPTKVYEYLVCGIPALLSDFPYWRENFPHGVRFCDPSRPSSIAEELERILGGEVQAGGREWALAHSWESTFQSLSGFYGRLLGSKRSLKVGESC